MPFRLPDPPLNENVVVPSDPKDPLNSLVIDRKFFQWLSALKDAVDRAPTAATSVNLRAQTEGVGPFNINGQLLGGQYRVNYVLRVAIPAGTSSSLQISFAWTDNGILRTRLGTLLVGNSTTEVDEQTFQANVDPAAPLTAEVLYGSVGVPDMAWDLDLVTEILG